MREILFRGKRVDNGEWETGSLVITRAGLSDERVYIADKMTGYYTPVIPETVGQYTGVTDKNGVKIFEGDILKAGCSMLIVWDEKFASWCVVRKGWAYKHFFGEGLSEEDCEVIGNINDNPELLKENENA